MNEKMKFTDAYWEIEQRIVTVEDISDICEESINTYHAQYENHLFCPECKQAQLVYVNGAIPYLRSFPHSEHTSDCSLRQAVHSVQRAKKLMNSTDTEDQEYVQRQIQSVLLRISRDSLMIKQAETKSTTLRSPRNKSNATASKAVINSRRLMQKNLYSRMAEDEYEVPMISYGTVKVTWEQRHDNRKNTMQYYLLLWRVKEAKRTDSNLICKILVSPKVYQHIPEDYKSLKNKECYVTLFSVFKNSGKKYKVTYLRYAQHIKILPRIIVV